MLVTVIDVKINLHREPIYLLMDEGQNKEKRDLLREPPLRYLGYTNEVGEAFRSQVHVKYVRLSYAIASGYVIADAIHKGNEAKEKSWPSQDIKKSKVRWAVIDTLAWQGLASVIIPGFTINVNCKIASAILRRFSKFPSPVQKWITTAYGLAIIPLIITPIDRFVDKFMEATLRRFYHIGPVMEEVVHHTRND